MVVEVATWEDLKKIINHPDSRTCIGSVIGQDSFIGAAKRDFLQNKVRYFSSDHYVTGYLRILEIGNDVFLDHVYPKEPELLDDVQELAVQLRTEKDHFYANSRGELFVLLYDLPTVNVQFDHPNFPEKTTMFPKNNFLYSLVDLYAGNNLDKLSSLIN